MLKKYLSKKVISYNLFINLKQKQINTKLQIFLLLELTINIKLVINNYNLIFLLNIIVLI